MRSSKSKETNRKENRVIKSYSYQDDFNVLLKRISIKKGLSIKNRILIEYGLGLYFEIKTYIVRALW